MSDAKSILLVDDDPNLMDIYKTVLTNDGYIVDIANNGEEGLLKAGQGGYDLILLDIVMPKMTGIDVLKGLKENYKNAKNGKIVIMTNLPQDPVLEEAMKEGALTYIIKVDLTPKEFVKRVHELLS